jgi:hypothetical protein
MFFKIEKKHILFTCLVLAGTSAGCEQKETLRRYEEVTIASPLERSSQSASDPHPFITQMTRKTGGAGMEMMGDPAGGPAPMGDSSAAMVDPGFEKMELPLSWSVPQGWREQTGSGIRLATFIADGIECSIVILGGAAGGLESNAARWMEQVNIPVPSPQELQAFIDSQERFSSKGGFEGVVIDLSQLQQDQDPSAASMAAAIISVDGSRAFVKMTGSLQAVRDNKQKFMELSVSLTKNE